MGETRRGRCELVFARGEGWRNSTSSTRSFSCAASSPSLLVRSTRHAPRTTVPRGQGMGMLCLGFSLKILFFGISISDEKPGFSGSPDIPAAVSLTPQLPSIMWESQSNFGAADRCSQRGRRARFLSVPSKRVRTQSTPSTSFFFFCSFFAHLPRSLKPPCITNHSAKIAGHRHVM